MHGYADGPADLAEGRTVHVLCTGDLGRRRPDGLFEIVGRRSRFVKPFGIRTDLDGLERLLAEHGIEAACTGSDDAIVMAACRDTGPDVATRVQTIVTARLSLPASILTVVVVDDLPRRPNGKIDHRAVARLARRPSPVQRPTARAASVLSTLRESMSTCSPREGISPYCPAQELLRSLPHLLRWLPTRAPPFPSALPEWVSATGIAFR